ncbi:MAG TPA: protein translocase subunit SecD [Nocardioidaceae bacterium]|nr:protein translocase subunit SecD [Nocardioidaceae bacterium]
MAAKSSKPVRTLAIFALVIVAMLAGAASLGSWKPKLGLDLAGGQRITLQAKPSAGGDVNKENLDQAVNIISDRVNGAGVSEAEVSTQGSDIIIVEIPGKPDENLASRIGETAQLRFRLVAQEIGPATTVAPTTTAPTTPTTPSSSGSTTAPPPSSSGSTTAPPPSSSGSTTAPPVVNPPTQSSTDEPAKPKSKPNSATSNTTSNKAAGNANMAGKPRKLTEAPVAAAPTTPGSTTGSSATTSPTTAPTDTSTSSAGSTTSPTEPTATGPTTGPPPALVAPQLVTIDDPYTWNTNPGAEWLGRLATFDCNKPLDPTQPGQFDIESQPLLACDDQGNRYLLGPSLIEGTDVTDASAGIPQGGVSYVVNVDFNSAGAKLFGDVTTRIAGTGQQLAIVLDGQVVSAPTNEQPINGGRAEISGPSTNPFSYGEASNLANTLKYGSLPLTFTTLATDNLGPELATNQLDAAILAGIIGLILVIAYCIVYYRGLAIVIIASLAIAGVLTYAAVLLLGHAYGFTLTLPGIAGFIVAVGITADSFIVYFERLRDEVRDGRTLRTAVETGWVRARATILAADAVSFLAALVLYFFAIGVVKGFAFALGLSTVIDVFVVFFWTKPMITLLAQTKFFGNGHKWSGLDRQHLGMPPLKKSAQPAGGEA